MCNKGVQLEGIPIDLEPSFWDKTNDRALEKIKKSFKIIKKLNDIHKEEDKALQILETLYKYVQPELNTHENIKMVPNQYGNLLGYSELSEEKELNQNFKEMLKNLFDYDISYYLKHKKLNYKISKNLSINEEIIEKINKGFTEDKDSKKLKEKAKEMIKFFPINKDDNNYVLKFIDCYKSLLKENFKEAEINTSNINIWDKTIKILLLELLEIINTDQNVKETSKRIGLDEDKTIEKLNIFYPILFKFGDQSKFKKFCFIPNERGIYKNYEKIFYNNNIDDEIKEVSTLLNEEESFDHILIHHNVNLGINHAEKKLEDIASFIDKEIKKNYLKINGQLQVEENVKIDEKIRKGCELLLKKWFKEHQDKIKIFEFTNLNLFDIWVKILFDEKKRKILHNLLIKDPESFVEMILFQDPDAPFFYSDQSYIEENESSISSSYDATLDESVNRDNFHNGFNLINNNNNNNNDLMKSII